MRSITKAVLSVAALGLLAQSQVMAAVITIPNGDFSSPDASVLLYGATNNVAPANWTVTTPASASYDFGVQLAANTDGSTSGQAAYLNNMAPASYINAQSYSQVLTTTVQPNTTYILSTSVGAAPSVSNYNVELLAGVGDLTDVSSPLPTPVAGTFVLVTKTYTTGASVSGTPLEIVLSAGGGAGVQVDFTAVTLDATAVPEPGLAGLVTATGGMGMLLRRRRA